MRRKTVKRIRTVIAVVLAILLAAAAAVPALAEGWQSTIIILDKEKKAYDIGETITFTIGIADPGGGYLISADSGFGYSRDTLKLVSETDSPDHVLLSGGPARWLYRDLTFEVVAPGTVYFVAGAYSGNGVIRAVRADGTVISCPRASVVYGAGPDKVEEPTEPEKEPEKEPLIESLSVKFSDTGEQIPLNRDPEPYITEYTAVLGAGDVGREIDVEAVPKENSHTVSVAGNMTLKKGENEIAAVVRNGDGETKTYSVCLTVPEPAVEITDIAVKKDGKREELGFELEKKEYEMSVPTDQDEIEFIIDAGEDAKIAIPDKTLEYGTNVKYVTAEVGDEQIRYTFYVYREPPELSLSQMVVELSDDTTLSMDSSFSPDRTEYEGNVTSDVQRAYIYAKAVQAETELIAKDDTGKKLDMRGDAYVMPLKNGENTSTLTVTDGYNTKEYLLKINRAFAEEVAPPPETEPPNNDLEFIHPEPKSYRAAIIGCVVAVVILIGGGAFIALRHARAYAASEEGMAEESEKQRNERLKEKSKEREKQLKEKQKEKLYR